MSNATTKAIGRVTNEGNRTEYDPERDITVHVADFGVSFRCEDTFEAMMPQLRELFVELEGHDAKVEEGGDGDEDERGRFYTTLYLIAPRDEITKCKTLFKKLLRKANTKN